MTASLAHAAADVVDMAIQWAAEDHHPKTAAGIALLAAVARYQRVRRQADSEPPMAFANEPATEPKKRTT